MKRLAGALVILVVAAVAIFWIQRATPRLSERQVRETVYVTLQREADTTFVVTGYIQLMVTTRAEDTRVLFPNTLDLSLGTTRATVRVPGRVSYGFDMAELTPDMIRLVGDTVEVELPHLTIYSAEPDLSELQVETTTGWARFAVTAQETERRAVQQSQPRAPHAGRDPPHRGDTAARQHRQNAPAPAHPPAPGRRPRGPQVPDPDG